jgi:hypothetical protein
MNNENTNTSGWDAITEVFDKLYPDQKEPKHYGTLISYELGGNDPLDGISIYDGGDFWHFVSYGFSDLYGEGNKDNNGGFSKYGIELTYKLSKKGLKEEEAEIKNVCGIMQWLARSTFQSGRPFLPNEWIYTGQKEGMDVNKTSKITGFITILDPLAKEIDTINGKVQFVQLVGMTDSELLKRKNKEITNEELYAKLSSDITDYTRESMF